MSYDGRSYRDHQPYPPDQRFQPNGPFTRPDFRPGDRRPYPTSEVSRFPNRGHHADSYSTGGRYSQHHAAGPFQSPPDRRSFHTSSYLPPGQSYGVHQNFQPHSQRPYPQCSFADQDVSRIVNRHSTGSYDNGARYNDRQMDTFVRNPRRESDPVPSNDRRSNTFAPNDLQSRTLRVTEFHPDVTKELLKELFIQVGPVRNVVLRPDHAFIEFQDTDSVAYALAAMDGVHMFGQPLRMEPKLNDPSAYRFLQQLKLFERQPELFGIVQ